MEGIEVCWQDKHPLEANLFTLKNETNKLVAENKNQSHFLLQNELKKCLFQSLKYTVEGKPFFNLKALLAALRLISESLGFEMYNTDDLLHNISICGTIFVIDVMMYFNCRLI
jgi:hypothetical protein